MPQGLDDIALKRETLTIQKKKGWGEVRGEGRFRAQVTGQTFIRMRSLPQTRREART